SDLAETITARVAAAEFGSLAARHGPPTLAGTGAPCRFALLALGKLGAREMNYHSDLDLMLVYEGDGPTAPPGRHGRPEPLEPFQSSTELARRLTRARSEVGPPGRLSPVDMRLRPTGKSGSLALPLAELNRYYADGPAQLWERQAMTRARA